jgi:Domain of unknown function (DUF4388)
MSFKGTLSELALADLIEITSLGAKTGVLEIAYPDGTQAGRVAFRQGALVSASCGALAGDRAFYALLGLKEGSFVFDPELDPGEASIDLPTGSLLMEAMRRVDEIGRLRDTLPSYARVLLLGGKPEDTVEAKVLGYLGPGERSVGDIVDGALVDGVADEYDVLRAIFRLQERGVVRALD